MMKAVILMSAVLAVSVPAWSQVASHAPTVATTTGNTTVPAQPVARVNGAVLTDRDLQRKIFAIFPYARQHGGNVPKELEPGIRNGALQMIIFEELVFQEAQRRKMTISPARMSRAEDDFRKQFSSAEEYRKFIAAECQGSQQTMREKIRRSLLIEQLLKSEVDNKSIVSMVATKAFYEKIPGNFQYPESFAIQTISFLPPEKPTPAQIQEARKRAEETLPKAKATKNYEEFGVLAETVSEDDYRVMMGDHKAVDRSQIAPSVLQALQWMQAGEVSNVIQVENAFTIVRLNKHVPAGKLKFGDVRAKLQKQLQEKKTNQVRADLNKKLQQNAKIEVL